MKFYISDTHFFHNNIIILCNRPYDTVIKMNKDLIERWNRKVGKNDEVYFLGDFAFKTTDIKEIYSILDKLNGTKYFIKGNHDEFVKDSKFRSYFVWIKDYAEIYDNGQKIILFHYPLEDWNGKFRGSFHLFGHIHNNDNITHIENRFNVCVEVNNYEPKTLQELKGSNND